MQRSSRRGILHTLLPTSPRISRNLELFWRLSSIARTPNSADLGACNLIDREPTRNTQVRRKDYPRVIVLEETHVWLPDTLITIDENLFQKN